MLFVDVALEKKVTFQDFSRHMRWKKIFHPEKRLLLTCEMKGSPLYNNCLLKYELFLIACTLVTEGCITFLMLRTVSFYDKIFVSAKKYQLLTQWPLLTSATLKFAQHFFSEATSNQSIYCDN